MMLLLLLMLLQLLLLLMRLVTLRIVLVVVVHCGAVLHQNIEALREEREVIISCWLQLPLPYDTHLNLLILGRVVDRRFAVFVERQFGAVIEQPSHHRQMAARGGEMQGRGTIAIA